MAKVEFFARPSGKKAPPIGHEMKLRCVECSEPANFGEGPNVEAASWWCGDCAPPRLKRPDLHLSQEPVDV